jgi:hypothetical protein
MWICVLAVLVAGATLMAKVGQELDIVLREFWLEKLRSALRNSDTRCRWS